MDQSSEKERALPKAVDYATLSGRLRAFALDHIVVAGYVAFLAAVTLAAVRIAAATGLTLRWPENPVPADTIAFVTLVLLVAVCFTLGRLRGEGDELA